jgi:serine/threonine-protein kinase
LGVTLYQLLCGELPFRGSKAMVVHQVLHDEPRRPRQIHDKIPRDLETICLKALAKTPARRYATARLMAEDLQRYLRGEPILARPTGNVARCWRWCRRKPLLAAVSASAVFFLVALLVVAGAFAWHYRQALHTSRRETARLAMDRGLMLCEQRDSSQGLLWLAHSLQLLPDDSTWPLGRANSVLCRRRCFTKRK